MTAATARYIITADDQTKAAIASVRRGFNDLSSGIGEAAESMKTLGRVFTGMIAGREIKKLFTEVISATAESSKGAYGFADALAQVKADATSLMASKSGLPAAIQSMQQLSAVLKDPEMVKAADDISSAMIEGFALAAEGAAKLIKLLHDTYMGLKIIGGGSGGNASQDARDQIDRLQAMQDSIYASSHGNPVGTQHQQIRDLAGQIAKLKDVADSGGDQSFLVAGPTDGLQQMQAIMDAYQKQLDAKSAAEDAAAEKAQHHFDQYYRGIGLQITYTDDLDKAIAKTGESMKDVADKDIKEVEAAVEQAMEANNASLQQMTVYAEQAARNIQDAMANFLFDPFKDGLKGMLRGFVDVLRQMVAQAGAADIMAAISGKGGGNLGSLFSGIKSLFGFADGGSFRVGGSGGTDSQPVAFMASPDETVTITKPGQGGGAPVINLTINAPNSTKDSVQMLPAIAQSIIERAVTLSRTSIKNDLSRGELR